MGVPESIEEFISKCESFDELPHNFDDTLVEKLVESVNFDLKMQETVEKLVKNVQFEGRCLPIQIVLRLLESAVRHQAFTDSELLTEFIVSSEVLLKQQRPASLIHDLFLFYANSTVFASRPAKGWLEVIRYSLTAIDDHVTSVFIRRQLQKFLGNLDGLDARRLMVISGIVEIFRRRISVDYLYDQIVDVASRLLDHFVDELVAEECLGIADGVREASRVGESTLKLLSRLSDSKHLQIPYTPDKWKNEANRVDFLIMIIRETREEEEYIANLLDFVIYSPVFKLHHHVSIANRLSDTQIKHLLKQLRQQADNSRLVPLRDVAQLIRIVGMKIGLAELNLLLNSIGRRIMMSSVVFAALKETFGESVLNEPEVEKYRESLYGWMQEGMNAMEWEIIDTVLEIEWLFPGILSKGDAIMSLVDQFWNRGMPYALATCLKIIRDNYPCCDANIIIDIVLKSPDPAPRIIAMDILYNDLNSIDNDKIWLIVERCLEDNDGPLRMAALKMARKAMEKKKGGDEIMKEILLEWINDKWIGDEVRNIIGCLGEPAEDRMVHLIEDMLQTLKIHRNENDTMDCY